MGEWLASTPWRRGETGLADAPCLEETLFNYYQRGEYDEWWANENNDQEPYLDRHADLPVAISGGWWDPFLRCIYKTLCRVEAPQRKPGPPGHGSVGARRDAQRRYSRRRCRFRPGSPVGHG